MSLSDWADLFTIAASLLALAGVLWLVYVQILMASLRSDKEVQTGAT